MSDLQCPATFLVARHGDATHPAPGMPADGGRLTAAGRDQAAALAGSLAGRRVAAVFTSTAGPAVGTGEVIAAGLGLRHRVTEGLQEFSTGRRAGAPRSDPRQILDTWLDGDLAAERPGGESGFEVIERYRDALSTIADGYRGETVVVISHGGVMSLVLPRLADNVPDDLARRRFPPHCVPVEARVDGDGWRVISWPTGRPGG